MHKFTITLLLSVIVIQQSLLLYSYLSVKFNILIFLLLSYHKLFFTFLCFRLRKRALQIYRDELNKPYSQDLGLHGTSRAALRVLCKETVLESSIQMRKKYSYSQTSSAHSSVIDNEDNAISKLKLLQKERLIVSRMGFAERAMELDREIDLMRVEAKKAREAEENTILFQRLKALALSHSRKEQRFEFILQEETRKMEEQFAKEEQEVGERQEKEFLRVLESASRRAVGRAKRCACQMPYLCRHNKSASYNTRRPVHTVIVYRRNAKRLKRAGRPEESEMWEEKAKEIDEKEQEKWRNKVANSIVASPWGANEAAVDQVEHSSVLFSKHCFYFVQLSHILKSVLGDSLSFHVH